MTIKLLLSIKLLRRSITTQLAGEPVKRFLTGRRRKEDRGAAQGNSPEHRWDVGSVDAFKAPQLQETFRASSITVPAGAELVVVSGATFRQRDQPVSVALGRPKDSHFLDHCYDPGKGRPEESDPESNSTPMRMFAR